MAFELICSVKDRIGSCTRSSSSVPYFSMPFGFIFFSLKHWPFASMRFYVTIFTYVHFCPFNRESGEPNKRKSYLPPEKQFLITRNGNNAIFYLKNYSYQSLFSYAIF